MKMVGCAFYFMVLGIASHFFGEALPRSWFDSDKAPYKSMAWEKNGTVYNRLRIRFWKDKVPDMSRYLPNMVPKKVGRTRETEKLDKLIQETCVAEFVHRVLLVAGLGCFFLWEGLGGAVSYLLWLLGNVPCILIQRYNRPRLKMLSERFSAKGHTLIPEGGAV